MKLNWTRRDFSAESPIRESLLMKLLAQKPEHIPEEYDEWIAAAGGSTEEQTVNYNKIIKKDKPF